MKYYASYLYIPNQENPGWGYGSLWIDIPKLTYDNIKMAEVEISKMPGVHSAVIISLIKLEE